MVETEDTVGAVVSELLLESSVLVGSSVVVVLSLFEGKELSGSLPFLQLTAVPIIIKNKIYAILLYLIFFTDKDMITPNNPSTTNIINNLGIIEKS